MSLSDMFVWRSKKERERERQKYERFAFPYGESQRREIERLLKELLPKEPGKTAMAVYLLGREGYLGSFKMDDEDRAERTKEESLNGAVYRLSLQLSGRYKAYLPYYLALILADVDIDEKLQYPSAEELRKKAEELKESLGLG